ncbi:hypothetical protein O3G_MSEX011920 [Manduca sexta]|uniref:Uncharacterized protein n=1 Tax=Manduca sexta TaxID=7130 RepID=A0A921ZN59_MANSE|nr:hypothetical protein O3G_MSEX011920 [Manduca sexta]
MKYDLFVTGRKKARTVTRTPTTMWRGYHRIVTSLSNVPEKSSPQTGLLLCGPGRAQVQLHLRSTGTAPSGPATDPSSRRRSEATPLYVRAAS